MHPVTGAETNSDGELVYFAEVAQDFDDFANAVAAKIQKEIEDAVDIAIEIELNPDPNPNRNPYVMNDTATTPSGSVSVDVLANDSDPDGDSLSISSVTNGQNGTVSITGNRLLYQPNSGFAGTDTFTYTATDGNLSGTATVTVTIGPEPPPTEETGDDVAPPVRAD